MSKISRKMPNPFARKIDPRDMIDLLWFRIVSGNKVEEVSVTAEKLLTGPNPEDFFRDAVACRVDGPIPIDPIINDLHANPNDYLVMVMVHLTQIGGAVKETCTGIEGIARARDIV